MSIRKRQRESVRWEAQLTRLSDVPRAGPITVTPGALHRAIGDAVHDALPAAWHILPDGGATHSRISRRVFELLHARAAS